VARVSALVVSMCGIESRRPPHLRFSGEDHGMVSGPNEVSPRGRWSNEINRSIGFVERCAWIVYRRTLRCEVNA
jgi:hypothetical protein